MTSENVQNCEWLLSFYETVVSNIINTFIGEGGGVRNREFPSLQDFHVVGSSSNTQLSVFCVLVNLIFLCAIFYLTLFLFLIFLFADLDEALTKIAVELSNCSSCG